MRGPTNPRRSAFRRGVQAKLKVLPFGDFVHIELPDNACDRRIAYQDVNLAAHAIYGPGNYELRGQRNGSVVRVRQFRLEIDRTEAA